MSQDFLFCLKVLSISEYVATKSAALADGISLKVESWLHVLILSVILVENGCLVTSTSTQVAVLPWRYDAEIGTANLLHASA